MKWQGVRIVVNIFVELNKHPLFLWDFRSILLRIMHMNVGAWECAHECWCYWRCEVFKYPGDGITGSFKPPNMDAETQIGPLQE